MKNAGFNFITGFVYMTRFQGRRNLEGEGGEVRELIASLPVFFNIAREQKSRQSVFNVSSPQKNNSKNTSFVPGVPYHNRTLLIRLALCFGQYTYKIVCSLVSNVCIDFV